MSEGWLSSDPKGVAAAPVDAGRPPIRLRQAREAAGLHIAALATALKVPVKKLEALEAGRYEELPDLTFARALASSACRHLKIDPAAVLDQIPAAHQPLLGPTDAIQEAPFKPGTPMGASSVSFTWLKRPAVVLSALALVAAAAVAWMPAPATWPMSEWLQRWTTSTAESPSSSVPPQPPVDAANSSADTTGVASGTVVENGQQASELQPSVLPISEISDGAPADASTAPVLALTAVSESWIEVIDGKGKLQVQRVIKAGERLDFSANPPYSVVLGRADGVQVQVRGQWFDVAPFARNSVARFEVK